jgi:hypothetical protein
MWESFTQEFGLFSLHPGPLQAAFTSAHSFFSPKYLFIFAVLGIDLKAHSCQASTLSLETGTGGEGSGSLDSVHCEPLFPHLQTGNNEPAS